MTSDIKDPIEKIVADALDAAAIPYIHEASKHLHGMRFERCLDFYLPTQKVMIECKAYHSDRVARQLADHENVILVQGRQAALTFAKMISKSLSE